MATISSPVNGQTVGQSYVVRGELDDGDVPKGRVAYIVHVHPDLPNLYWAKRARKPIGSSGGFELRVHESSMRPIQVKLVHVSEATAALIEQWLDEGDRTQHYPGLKLDKLKFVTLHSVSIVVRDRLPQRIAISYSHKDSEGLDALEVQL